MPGGKSFFRDDWLKKSDNHGNLIGEWCERSKNCKFSGYCVLCKKKIQCDNQGLQQIIQHASGKNHSKAARELLSCAQQKITLTSALASDTNSNNLENFSSLKRQSVLNCFTSRDQATAAELLWSMKVVSAHYSYSSCDEIADLFKTMFPDSFPLYFSMSASKISYLISEATGPYFHHRLLEDLKSGSKFSLLYDETSNKQVKKQLDIKIRFWSSFKNEVCVQHLETFLMGHATGEQLSFNVIKSVEGNGLSLNNLVMLGSDGPNVNKSVITKLNNALIKLNRPKLVDVGFCNLHVAHNAFGKGLKVFGQEVVDLVIDLYMWFKLSPSRREDFVFVQQDLQVDEHLFLKHVECRWLTLAPAIKRIIEQWNALIKYFLTDLPKSNTKVFENARYKRIKHLLCNKVVFLQLHFLDSVSPIFTSFLAFFQKEEPLIHILFDSLCLLLKKLMFRFLKREKVSGSEDMNLNEESDMQFLLLDLNIVDNQLPDDLLDLGEKARNLLKSVPPLDQKAVIYGTREFYVKATEYLLSKLPLSNPFLKYCKFLIPEHRHAPWALKAVKYVAKQLPINVSMDTLSDEWHMYETETVPDEWIFSQDFDGKKTMNRIDHYWRNIFEITLIDSEKYPELKKVVKGTCVVSHGNSDVERGFSVSGLNITSARANLSQTSVNGIRSTSDGLRIYCNNKPHLLKISKEFIKLGQNAHKSYSDRIKEEKKMLEEKRKLQIAKKLETEAEKQRLKKTAEELALRKQTHTRLQKQEGILADEEKEISQEFDTGKSIFEQANEKLKIALKNKNFKEMAVAQALLETAQKKISHAHSHLNNNRQKQKTVEKRKQTLIESFICKKIPKTK